MTSTYATKKNRRAHQKVFTQSERLISWYQTFEKSELLALEASEYEQERAHQLFLEWSRNKDKAAQPVQFIQRTLVEKEPDNLTVIERKLYNANKLDFEWYRTYFADLPSYLTKYFANRYLAILKKSGNRAANIFLREKMHPAQARVRMVMDQYKHLPTTHKMASLSTEYDVEQSDFQPPETKQLGFDFEQIEKNAKPAKNRILAELERDEIKEMAFKLSCILNKKFQILSAQHKQETDEEVEQAMIIVYESLAAFLSSFGITPPRKYKKQTWLSAATDMSKIKSDGWLFDRLTRIRKTMREHLAIAMGQVSARASAYCSWDCLREHKEQKEKNWEFIKNGMLFEQDTGEEADLMNMVLKSISNPAILRHELMARCRGYEDIGSLLNLQGMFLTLTAPGKYHNSYQSGGFIPHWNGASPKQTQGYLNNVWQRIRAKLDREGIRWFGLRVAEPHHDGTPHWHLLLWVRPQDALAVSDIFIRYAVREDAMELFKKADLYYPVAYQAPQYCAPTVAPKNGFKVPHKIYAKDFPCQVADLRPKVEIPDLVRAATMQNKVTLLNIDYKARCDVKFIDPNQGTATGYIAKYIAKNIDGYAMDDLVSDETGKSVKDMAKNVTAWKSRHCIRQFQFFGGAPVTTYRELRRYANLDKASFMDYLTQLNRSEMLDIYLEMERKPNKKFVGPAIPDHLLKDAKRFDAKRLFIMLGENYQPTMDNKSESAVAAMEAADKGDFKGYVMGQGGPFVARENLAIKNVYQELPFASPHGETVRKLEGFDASGVKVKTRTKNWSITKKPTTKARQEKEFEVIKATANPSSWKIRRKRTSVNESAEVEATTQGSAATVMGGVAASRSSVNNCTHPPGEQGASDNERPLDPLVEYEISRLISDHDFTENIRQRLMKGQWVRVTEEKSVKLHLGDGQRRPDQIVYRHNIKPDLSWLGETEPEIEPLTEENYQQPNLSHFEYVEGWPVV
ncbi:replication endonuclease [Vibrio fluvialis]|uniref:replication endonuclease n=1 Tax=Vibrio fluvialis TaxID=676 RepID=UPI001EEC79CE|nr:replication endonuclease [Vibrio fluvialis]MCG6368927.1 replication endonuclease [Vibrio fluvialis]MCG6377691.1 replication endonuclease [Vibrio fluvialis]